MNFVINDLDFTDSFSLRVPVYFDLAINEPKESFHHTKDDFCFDVLKIIKKLIPMITQVVDRFKNKLPPKREFYLKKLTDKK